jgi:magnesium transporter
VQFVLFTLSAIIGSAILYGDFRKATFHQIVTFLYGCTATFLGVFIIAWAPSSADPNEHAIEHGDGAAESIIGRGNLGRKKRAMLARPSGIRDLPTVKHQHNLNLIGLSPGQVRNLYS